MLGALILSFIGALVFAILPLVGSIIINKVRDKAINYSIGWTLFSFIINFAGLLTYLYVNCIEQTPLTAIRWMWPALLVEAFIGIFFVDMYSDYPEQFVITCVLALISAIICFSTLFGPVQNMVYTHDMEKVDITYAVKSDEILAKVELSIDNASYEWDRYSVESPEMRQVNGEFIAVYHIIDNKADCGGGNTEYIPGYGIQEKGELPKIISKRIYFDTSYVGKKDALRTIRRKYPTIVIGDHKFDIDDEWNPYEIFEYREKKYSTTGEDYGLIILNLMNGTCEKYPVAEGKIPSWVDYTTTYPR